jgi:hypothetical protein
MMKLLAACAVLGLSVACGGSPPSAPSTYTGSWKYSETITGTCQGVAKPIVVSSTGTLSITNVGDALDFGVNEGNSPQCTLTLTTGDTDATLSPTGQDCTGSGTTNAGVAYTYQEVYTGGTMTTQGNSATITLDSNVQYSGGLTNTCTGHAVLTMSK